MARSIQWQASVLGPLTERELPTGHLRILDCACGIGTQTLGLAERGHALVGTDLSAAAIARARREAQQRSLSIQFEVADMSELSGVSKSDFDVVLASDNALRICLRNRISSGRLSRFAANSAEADYLWQALAITTEIIVNHPAMPPPTFFQDGEYPNLRPGLGLDQ